MNINDNVKMYDVAVIGAGVVGCAIARYLSQYDLDCVLIEAGPDIGIGTSKANTAILHTGFDTKSGTLENELVRRGYHLLRDYALEVGIPLEPIGGLLIAWDHEQEQSLPQIQKRAKKNGVEAKLVSKDDLYCLEPELGPGGLAGLLIPGESAICPFTTTLAFATQAVLNGISLVLDAPVQSIVTENGVHELSTPNEVISCRHLVNAAGINSDVINKMMGHTEFTVIPRRGELIVFDKFASELINHIILPVPSKMGKGVLISPTVYGNVLLGPTAEDVTNKYATETTSHGLSYLIEKGTKILPSLINEEITAAYAGIRAATDHDDYQIFSDPEQKYICVGGIRSTGLSASMSIAETVIDLLEKSGLNFEEKNTFKNVQMPYIGETLLRPYKSQQLIEQEPDYGEIVCHCEKVTRGEIKATFFSPIPPQNVDGLRRRTRVLMGRCQGFYCQANILSQFQAGQNNQMVESLNQEMENGNSRS
jgi:glycerol-3-phosphate dehydrogenase